MLMQSILRRVVFAGVFALTATMSRGARRVPYAYRKSLRADSGHYENGDLFLPRTLEGRTSKKIASRNAGLRTSSRNFSRINPGTTSTSNTLSAQDNRKCVTRVKTVPRFAMARRCIGLGKILPSSLFAADRIRNEI